MKRGFTLIQSIIVAAILCTLAILIFLAVDPIEKSAKARDSELLKATSQLGQDLVTYKTWSAALENDYSALKILPCVSNNQPDKCYKNVNESMVTYARLSSKINNSRCPANTFAWAVYSSADTKGGIVCIQSGSEPAPGNQNFLP